ncbi:golgi-body localization protein domain-containing protein [Limtongia smithiae]|uniref:golgi-body localization protein domain-containing protein n=1 Tax=Limtongia smithiae TaxID=1125753 RepID=UPI0034CFA9C4
MQRPEGISLMLVELGAAFFLAHLLAFVVFGFIRIVTGVSINRLGYLSLRHISFSLRSGIVVDIGRAKIDFHRPAFSRPSWISLTVSDISLYFDSLDEYVASAGILSSSASFHFSSTSNLAAAIKTSATLDAAHTLMSHIASASGTPTIERDNAIRTLIKRFTSAVITIHRLLKFIRLVDLNVRNISLITEDIGTINIRSISFNADQVNPESKLPHYFSAACEADELKSGELAAVTWRFGLKDVFYIPDRSHAEEILDVFQIDLHETFFRSSFKTRNLYVNVRVGNLNMPYDSFLIMHSRMKLRRARALARTPASQRSPRVVAQSAANLPPEFFQAAYKLIDIVGEIRIHAAKLGIYKFSPPTAFEHLELTKAHPINFNITAKDFTIDLRRLSSNSPGHRMFFDYADVSHQAILTAISVTVGLHDTRTGVYDELVYVPMITMTSTTNFLRKSLDIYTRAEKDQNSSLLKGSLTITSPAVDVRARHLPLFVAMISASKTRSDRNKKQYPLRRNSTVLAAQQAIGLVALLPRTIIKLTIEEPAARIKVSEAEVELVHGIDEDGKLENDNDRLLASSCSLISCQFESSHTSTPYSHYGATMSFRLSDLRTWLRSPTGPRYDLLKAETLLFKLAAETSPNLDVSVTGYIGSFGLSLTRPEIISSLKDLLAHVRFEVKSLHSMVQETASEVEKEYDSSSDNQYRVAHSEQNLLSRVPSWLSHMRIEGADITLSTSIVDNHADTAHCGGGTSNQLESWIIEYKPHVPMHHSRKSNRRQTRSPQDSPKSPRSPDADASSWSNYPRDRRRLALAVRGVEICTMDLDGVVDRATPLISMPDIELAVASYFDDFVPVTEFNVLLKKMTVNYSILHHYSMLLSLKTITQTFSRWWPDQYQRYQQIHPARLDSNSKHIVYVDVRTQQICAKIRLPGAPTLMLETVGLEFSQRTTGIPLMRAKYLRLFVESPSVFDAWERLIVLRHLRVEFKRHHPHPKSGNTSSAARVEDDIIFDADTMSISVPYGLLPYQLLEGIISSIKALKQLHHQYKYDTDEYILSPQVEKPKKFPRVRVRSRLLEMWLDDDPFEARLGIIFRTGLIEMNSRIAREAAFEAKVQALEAAAAKRKEQQSSVGHENGEDESEAPVTDEQTQGVEGIEQPLKNPTRKRGAFKAMRSGKQRRGKRSRVPEPIRYAPTEAGVPSDSAKISMEAAYIKLQELHSQSWIRRITKARRSRTAANEAQRVKLAGVDEVEAEIAAHERIISIPDSHPLFHCLFSDSNILVDKPTFPMEELSKFLFTIGKGIPKSTEYTLLLPFFFQWNMSEAKILLRDYPLPFFHVPPVEAVQNITMPSWSLRGDLVIAEEMFDESSWRYAYVPIVQSTDGNADEDYTIKVTRTVSPIKMYSKLDISIATSDPTRITWAPSFQPAVQQAMMIFDTFTKPPMDPSEKVGFWDKIRLIFHSKMRFTWNQGAVHLLLKGSRDPYRVTGEGSGFAMCWENNVIWNINSNGDQRDFMIVDSQSFILAIPDFEYYVRQMDQNYEPGDETRSSTSSAMEYQSSSNFQKIIMKLSGHVRWKAGMLFERDIEDGRRSFDFIPHYHVQLRRPDAIDLSKPYDSYAGFRSNYIHLALSVLSPADQQWDAFKTTESSSTNSIHLSPLGFTHFFKWWNLFSGEMALPIRTGNLFPLSSVSKKFGRHLATIKYQFVLSPLSICHTYLHRRDEDWIKAQLKSIGLKVRTNSFMMDIHQRRETITFTDKVLNTSSVRRKMKINVAEVDFHSADIRAMTATFKERSPEELVSQISGDQSGADSDSESRTDGSAFSPPLLGTFRIPNNDTTWLDIDDYTEMSSFVGINNLISVKILPLLYTPRFTYYRQTEHQQKDDIPKPAASLASLPFGNEPSHVCLMGQTDTMKFQTELIASRARELEKQIAANTALVDDLQRTARLFTENNVARQKFMSAKKDAEILQLKHHTLHQLWLSLLESSGQISMEDIYNHQQAQNEGHPQPCSVEENLFAKDTQDVTVHLQTLRDLGTDTSFAFNNRFIFHSVQIKWTNSVRNTFLRYTHQVGQRRGLIYYMSQRAVKFIEDLVKEQQASKEIVPESVNVSKPDTSKEFEEAGAEKSDLEEIEERAYSKLLPTKSVEEREKDATQAMIDQLLNDSAANFVVSADAGQANRRQARHRLHQQSRPPLSRPKSSETTKTTVDNSSRSVTIEEVNESESLHSSKILLATDFSDLSGAPEMVESLQREIMQLEEIRLQFHIYSSDLDEQSWRDLRNVTLELKNAREELFFIMKAITTGQRRHYDKDSESTGVLQWHIAGRQIIAHLLQEDRTPFVDIALANGTFRRIENSDGSNNNTLSIGMLQGVNLLKDALYPELLSPYFEAMDEADKNRKAVRIYWYLLEAIGGIPVMDHFEVNLIPMKIQLEYDIGQKLFQYIFPGDKQSPFQVVRGTDTAKPNASSASINNLRPGSDAASPILSDSDNSSDSSEYQEGSPQTQTKGFPFGNRRDSGSKDRSSLNLTSWGRRVRSGTESSLRPNINSLRRVPSKSRIGDTASIKSFVSGNSDNSRLHLAVGLPRPNGFESHIMKDDDLTEMVHRAASYMTFVYVTIPSVVLCISYKGKSTRNIEDVNEFVFRMPTIEYQNKTWSNLDLAMRLKKDVVKTLISHAGAIIENKIKHGGPSSKKRKQQPLIRQITTYASFTSLADLSETRTSRTHTAGSGSSSTHDKKSSTSSGKR